MSEQLVIRLGSRPEQAISWLVWAPSSQEVIASGELANAGNLPALAERLGKRPAVVLLPASDVVLKQVALPSKPNRQVLQALPYMLEEEQAEDVDELFIALGKLIVDGEKYYQQVAICQRERLVAWLALLNEAGFSVTKMLPDALLLPEDNKPCCIQLQEQWLLKQGSWQVSAIDNTWWPDYLALENFATLTSYSPWPDNMPVFAELATPELPLALLATQLNKHDFTLLQGEFKPKRQVNKNLKRWQNTGVLAASVVVLYLLQLAVGNWQLNKEALTLQSQSSALYLQAFPNERVVNLNRQIQQKLNVVGSSDSPNFLVLLNSLQNNLANMPDFTLENLRFDDKRSELRFQAQASSFQSFERLKSTLEQAGFIVEQGALSNNGGKVQGSIAMRGKV